MKKVFGTIGRVVFMLFFILFAIVSLSEGGFLSGIIFLLAAFLVSPFSGALPFLNRKSVLSIVSSVVLFVVGCIMAPEISEDTDRAMGDTTANVEESTLPYEEATTTGHTQTEESTAEQETTEFMELTEQILTEQTISEVTALEVSTADSETTPVTESIESTESTKETTSRITTTTTTITTTTTTTMSETVRTSTEAETSAKEGRLYILNTNPKSLRFHYPSCGSVDTMNAENKQEFFGTREEVLDKGYTPCGNCKP